MNRRFPYEEILNDLSREEIASDLAAFPIFADFLLEDRLIIADMISYQAFRPGEVIFSQDQMGEHLYLVAKGTLLQTGTAPDGIAWLPRTLTRGDVFGRYALLTGNPQETTVEAREYGYLYRIHASDLGYIFFRWPRVRDALVPEARIRRLRSQPLYSPLPDDHLRRLADHIRELHLLPGQIYRRQEGEPHIWVIAQGQVMVQPVEEEDLPSGREANQRLTLLTVGHPFVDGLIPSTGLTPQQAQATCVTLLYGLPEPAFEGLVERFREPGLRYPGGILHFVRRPDIPRRFRAARLFATLPPEMLSDLAGFVAWIYVPPPQSIVQQGVAGRAFYILDEGEAIVRATDDRGRERPRNYFFAGTAFGEHALLAGMPHDVTVEATKPSYWLRLTREDLQRFDESRMPDRKSQMWQNVRCLWYDLREFLRGPGRRVPSRPCPHRWRSVWGMLQGREPFPVAPVVRRHFSWQEEGEEVHWFGRKHVAFFTLRVIAPLLVLIGGMAILGLGLREVLPLPLLLVLVAALSLDAFVVLYLVLDYRNDFYAVTNRRVVHQDRLLFLREVREEVPLDRIQDVIRRRELVGSLVGYGDLLVQTAAMGGGITMRKIPDPDQVRSIIFAERARMRAERYAWRKEKFRRDLKIRLELGILAEWPDVALGPGWHLSLVARRRRPLRQRGKRRWTWVFVPWRWPSVLLVPVLRRFWYLVPGPLRTLLALPFRGLALLAGPIRRTRVGRRARGGGLETPWWPRFTWQGDSYIIWRKHWLNMVRRVAPPLLLLLLLSALIVVVLISPLEIEFVPPDVRRGVVVALLFLDLLAFFWTVWQYDDWRNDLYILTNDRLIDVRKRPLFLQEERREAPLDRVQNVRLEIAGLLANLFNYGNVVVQTAAAEGDISFNMVPDPRRVNQEISRRVEAYRQMLEEAVHEHRQALIAESLEIYDELVHGRHPRRQRHWRREDL